MKSEESKKSHSWCWDNHISPKDSKWLAENLEEMDNSVKHMLKLTDEEGYSSANKAEIYFKKRPELIAHIEQFYRSYQSLAQRYDDLSKNIASALQMQSPGFSDSFDLASPLVTPDRKLGLNKSREQIVGSDLVLSSGGASSDLSLEGSSESSSSPSSDSDSESFNSSSNKNLESPVNGEGKGLHQIFVEMEMELPGMEKKVQVNLEENVDRTLLEQITKYEEELRISNEKLRFSEEEIARLKDELNKNESIVALMNSKETDLELAQQEIVVLEAKLDVEKRQVLELKERIVKYTSDVLDRDREIKGLNVSLSDIEKSFSLEKTKFLDNISNLSKQQAILEARLQELELQNVSLEDEIRKYETDKIEMRHFHDARERSLKFDVNRLNKDLDAIKLRYDMLMAEKDGVNAKLQTLMAEMCCRDNRIQQLEEHVNQTHMQQAELIMESESARKLSNELRSRVRDLEKEVERQTIAISDRAEEKREAIRQLCFSLEHYRSGYEELRQAFIGHKRHAVLGW